MAMNEYNLNENGFRETEVHELDLLIERCGMQMLLQQLSEICGNRAEYHAKSLQDTTTAKQWATLEGALGAASVTASGL